jgi:hypothetical protein
MTAARRDAAGAYYCAMSRHYANADVGRRLLAIRLLKRTDCTVS